MAVMTAAEFQKAAAIDALLLQGPGQGIVRWEHKAHLSVIFCPGSEPAPVTRNRVLFFPGRFSLE